MDFVPSRRSVAGATALAAGTALFAAGNAAPAAAAMTATGINVKDFGAVGDGVTNDSSAVKLALDTAKGDLVYFPSGTYVLDRVPVNSTGDILLGVGAVLLHLADSPGNYMFAQNGRFLRIRGGTIDGNKANQSGRPMIIAATLSSDSQLIVEGVHFRNTVRAAVYIQNFGGECDFNHCTITGQAEHDGVAGHSTSIVHVTSGEAEARANLKFNFNRAVFDTAPRVAGSNPGGVFVATGTGSDGMSCTFEAYGNYFYGYGQNLAGNGISALHTYPFVRGARWSGNYFESCALSAMTAKSVDDFICTDNVVVSGVTSSANVASEGAICYAPSYHAGSTSHPRAIIANNIVTDPGGQADRVQNGISIFGSSTSWAQQVVVSGNVLTDCGMGISATYVTDATIDGNIINSTAMPNGAHGGIRFDYAKDVSIRNNRITTNAGYGLFLVYGMSDAKAVVQNNSFRQKVSGIYALVTRGLASVQASGNEFDAASHAVTFRGYGTRKLQRVLWDPSNVVINGAFAPVFDEIGEVYGELAYVNSPNGRVFAGEKGVRYTARNLSPGNVYWVATERGLNGWVNIA